MKGRFISLINFKHTLAIIFLLSCMLIFVAQAVSVMTVWCKDCGNEDNCNQGSGLDSGYQDCWIDNEGKCHVEIWGGCNPMTS